MILGTDEKPAPWKHFGPCRRWLNNVNNSFGSYKLLQLEHLPTPRMLYYELFTAIITTLVSVEFHVFVLRYKFFIFSYKSFALVSSNHLLKCSRFFLNKVFHQLLINNNVRVINAVVNHLTTGLPNWVKTGLINLVAFTLSVIIILMKYCFSVISNYLYYKLLSTTEEFFIQRNIS